MTTTREQGLEQLQPVAETTARYLKRERYREALEEVDHVLGDLYFELQEIISEVAVEGSFKEWADQQGVLLETDALDLETADDPVLKELAALHDHVDRVLRRLPRRGPALPPQ